MKQFGKMNQEIIVIPVATLKEIIREEVSKVSSKEPSQPQKEAKLITRQETAKLLGISLPTLGKYVKEDIIPAYYIGRNVRFKLHEVEDSMLRIRTSKHKV